MRWVTLKKIGTKHKNQYQYRLREDMTSLQVLKFLGRLPHPICPSGSRFHFMILEVMSGRRGEDGESSRNSQLPNYPMYKLWNRSELWFKCGPCSTNQNTYKTIIYFYQPFKCCNLLKNGSYPGHIWATGPSLYFGYGFKYKRKKCFQFYLSPHRPLPIHFFLWWSGLSRDS